MSIVIGNIISFFGALVDFLFNLKFNEKPKILLGNIFSSTMSTIAYIFLKAYDGVTNCIVTIIRLITIYLKDKYHKNCNFLFIIFLGLYSLVFLHFAGLQTIILFLSTMCVFIPKWIFKDMQKIRVGSFLAHVLSIIYNIMIINYAVILIHIMCCILVIITFTKWHNKNNNRTIHKK